MAALFLIVYFIFLCLGLGLVFTKKWRIAGKVILSAILFTTLWIADVFIIFLLMFSSVRADVYAIFVLIFSLWLFLLLLMLLWKQIRKRKVYIPLLSALGILAASLGIYQGAVIYDEQIPTVGERENLLTAYTPYGQNTKVAVLDEESQLKFDGEEELPVMDGATALYPVYSAFARAVYPENLMRDEKNPYLKCTTTANAYDRLLNGEVDIIFVAAPSEKQLQAAKDAGETFVFHPIGREAFVFFVNAKNPIEGMTVDQIQKIYSGEVTKWEEFGVSLGEIRAFQREEGSGRQSALQNLMKGKELATPPTHDVIQGMGGIVQKTADYKNYRNAIGFSFRFYATEMVENNQIKLLDIDGVPPTEENIAAGTYPIASEFYAVTREETDENTKKFLQWMTGPQGQELVEKTGYTPLQ